MPLICYWSTLYYPLFPSAIDIIPTSLVVAYSFGKYINDKSMSHCVTYSPTHNQFSCFQWPPCCVPSVVSTKNVVTLLPEALWHPLSDPQVGLGAQDYSRLRISLFRTRIGRTVPILKPPQSPHWYLGAVDHAKIPPPHPWPHGNPSLIALIGPLRPYCSQVLWSCSGVSRK